MKKQSKLLALLLACAMTLALSACGGSSATTSTPASSAAPAASGSAAATGDKTYTIGICQLVQHNALDAATKGFKDALTEKLGDKVKFDEQNAAGDSATCATICNQFVSSNVDLIMANATPALQAATAATNSIPILGTSVTDYGTALSITDWKGTTGTNVTGTADLVVSAQCDIGALAVDVGDHGAGVSIKAVLCTGVTDIRDDLADDLLEIDIAVGGDLAHNVDQTGGSAGLAGHAGIGIVGQDLVQDGIGDLVADLVRMSLGDGLRSKQVSCHKFCPPCVW